MKKNTAIDRILKREGAIEVHVTPQLILPDHGSEEREPEKLASTRIGPTQGSQETQETEGTQPGQPGGAGPMQTECRLPKTGTPAARIVYVLDRSVSMGLCEALEVARRELSLAMEQLPASANVQVLVYNRRVRPLLVAANGLHSVNPDTIARLRYALSEVTAEGSTDHLAALRAALALRPEMLVWLTDADDVKLAEVDGITKLNEGKVSVHVVEFRHRSTTQETPLQRLANTNSGTYRRISPRP
jgi:hypothetical protein